MEKRKKIGWKRASIESRPRLKWSCKLAVTRYRYTWSKNDVIS